MSDFLNTEQLSGGFPALFTVSMLKKSRMKYSTISGPPSFNIGKKVIYYRPDVLDWISSQKTNANKSASPVQARRAGPGRPSKAVEIERRASAA